MLLIILPTDDDEETDLSTITAVCGAADTSEGAPCVIGGATSPNYTPVMADLAPLDTTTDDLTDRQDRRLGARVTYTDTYVTDGDDEGTADDGDSMQVVLQASVEVENPANSAPKFRDDQDANTPGDQADASRAVPENAKGAAVGDPVTASDTGDLLIYSLSGADAASFTVDSGLKSGDTPGLIKTAVKLDYETKDMYMVVVTATDPSGATDTINVHIEVIDEDDKTVVTLGAAENTPPAFATDTATRSVDENMYAGAAVGDPVTAMDAGDTVTYTLSGSTYFGIDGSSGQISTTMVLDHETMSSHTVTVTASDEEGATDTVNVTINVNDAHPGCTYELVDTGELILGLTNDCEALLDAKEDLGGDLSWSGDTNIVEWDGVTVTYFVDVGVASSRVRRIWLRGAGLDGSVSAALGRLEMLRVLNLHSNNLSGPIPDLSGTMLQELYLNNNYDEDVAGSGLTGGVPAWLNTMTDMNGALALGQHALGRVAGS